VAFEPEFLDSALAAISSAGTLAELDRVRVHWLGRQGILSEAFRQLATLSGAERSAAGQGLNRARDAIEEAIRKRRESLESDDVQRQLARKRVDVTLPGRGVLPGALHPLTQARLLIENHFQGSGFTIATGPEIEDDFHNFTALNMGPDHPARAAHDTFYLDPGSILLRTHTSPVQVRALRRWGPPLRIMAPGRVYRRDSDLTHTPMFHQVEGLVVDREISWAEMTGLLSDFLHAFFTEGLKIRFRPSYFPFTEPSAEVDLECFFCAQKGCRVCKQSGWIEVLGCGLVHPEVFRQSGVDPGEWSGLAFGMGIERLAMLKYRIGDIRWFYDNDLRFLTPRPAASGS
jgi:phenylalanyl-tRNA synthetase alpha chain